MNVPTDISLQVVGSVAAALLVAAVVALIATPVVRSLAFKIGAVDVPRDSRRMHDHPIPRMGGLAIFFGFILSVLLFLPLTTQLRGMLLGAVVIVILGIFDDIYALSAKLKFAVQIGAALIAVLMGNQIDYLSNPNIFSSDPYWHLGVLSIPISVLWIVAITNAVNLIDGLDGLAAGIAAIASFFLFLIAFGRGLEETAMLSIILLGATLAFLRYNFAPASIFMGDSGSLLLGAMIGVISLMGVMRSPTVIVLAVPLVIAAIPIADTAAAIIRRVYHHQPIQQADRKHLHHMLLRKGYGVRKSVVIVYAWTALLGVGAWVMSSTHGVAVWAMIAIMLLGSFLILWRLGIFDQVLRHHYHGRHTRQEDKPRWYGRHGR